MTQIRNGIMCVYTTVYARTYGIRHCQLQKSIEMSFPDARTKELRLLPPQVHVHEFSNQDRGDGEAGAC